MSNGVISLKFLKGTSPTFFRFLSLYKANSSTAGYGFLPDDMWQIQFRSQTSPFQIYTIGPSNTTFNLSVSQNPGTLTATWSQVDPPAPFPQGVTFSVTMAFSLAAGDYAAEVNTSVNLQGSGLSIYSVVAPRLIIQAGQQGDSSTEVLATPYYDGLLTRNPLSRASVPNFPPIDGIEKRAKYPGELSMQFASYYNEAGGSASLFVGTRDGAVANYGYYKEFGFFRTDAVNGGASPDSLLFDLRSVPENNLSVSTYSSQFPYVLGLLDGGWYEAALAYRNWVMGGGGKPWVAGGPIRTNSAFSSYVKNAVAFPVVKMPTCTSTCSEGPTAQNFLFQHWSDVLPELDDEKSVLGLGSLQQPLIPFVSFFYEWEKGAFGGRWGEWAPERPEFVAAAPTIAASGYPFGPYFHPGLYQSNSPGFNDGAVGSQIRHMYGSAYTDAEAYIILDENGNPPFGINSEGTHDNSCGSSGPCGSYPAYMIDYAANFSRDWVKSWSEDLFALGAKGIYLDTFTASAPVLTYATPTGHTQTGGGNWYVQKMLGIVDSAKALIEPQDPNFYVHSESSNELFVKNVELTHSQFADLVSTQQPGVFTAPLYHTVYHDYQRSCRFASVIDPSYGDNPNTMLFARRFYSSNLFMGLAPQAGGVINSVRMSQYDDPNVFPNYSKFIDMIRAHLDVLKRPTAHAYVSQGRRLKDPEATSATIDVGDFVQAAPYSETQPLVYVAAHGRADLQGFSILCLNWTHTADTSIGGGSQPVTFSVKPSEYGLSNGSYRRTEISSFSAEQTTTLTLPTLEALTIPQISATLIVYEKL